MKHGKAFAGACLVAVATAIILPVFFGEAATFEDRAGGDSWRNLIYDFQTLFTGLAAVAAAIWTIGAMRRSDQLQKDIAVRAERRQVQWLVEFLAVQLEKNAVMLHGHSSIISRYEVERVWTSQVDASTYMMISTMIYLRRLLRGPRVAAAIHLFDAPLEMAYYNSNIPLETLDRLEERYPAWSKALPAAEAPEFFDPEVLFLAYGAPRATSELAAAIRAFADRYRADLGP